MQIAYEQRCATYEKGLRVASNLNMASMPHPVAGTCKIIGFVSARFVGIFYGKFLAAEEEMKALEHCNGGICICEPSTPQESVKHQRERR